MLAPAGYNEKRMSMQPLRILAVASAFTLLNACASVPKDAGVSALGADAADNALRMIGRPYHYGGTSPRGFDCSGLIQYAYLQAGLQVPRTTYTQRDRSRFVSRDRMRRGDLLFFNQEGKWSSHVAIYVGENRFVHAPSRGKTVRLDTLSNPYWQRHLVDVRRF